MISRFKIKFTLAIVVCFVFIAANFQDATIKQGNWERPTIIFPEDNPISDASIELGSNLFFETLLSKDSSISCQSCHMITESFADHLPVGEGIKGRKVTRNTPSLINIGLHPYFMADGKFSSLEEQVMGPINEHREFDMSAEEVVARLKDLDTYKRLSKEAYGEELSIEIIQKALANFQRILNSQDSKFDLYMKGEVELSSEEMNGWKLFNQSGLNCIQCHSGFNFTNYSFENNGLYSIYQDSGRALITKTPEDLAKFKVPSLRNVAITFPYMHNGSIKTLEEVIKHYASGGSGHQSQSELIQGFSLEPQQESDLIAFLNTLTEERFLEKNE